MIHKFIEIAKEDLAIESPNKAMYIMKCPICGKIEASAMSYSLLPNVLWCSGEPNHEDWKEYKKEKGLTNDDIARIVGLSPDSVKNQTAPAKELPKWAISMLYEWKN